MTLTVRRGRIFNTLAATVIILVFISPTLFAQQRGDVNLNEIPYEIADAVIFEQYFTYGLGAFTINLEGQVSTTDINIDGLVLSYADYLYMLRIIDGDLPPENPPIDTVKALTFTELTDSSLIVYGWADQELGMLTLELTAMDMASYEVRAMPAVADMLYEEIYVDLIGQLSLIFRQTLAEPGSYPGGYLPVVELVYESEKAVPSLNIALATGHNGEAVSFTPDNSFSIGDVNVNGIPYEIADVVLYMNALVYGVSAFTASPQVQILNSDCNQDGIPLTVQDMEYALLVVLGEISPGDPVGPEFAGEVISLETDGSITVKTGFENAVGGMIFKYYAPAIGNYTLTPSPVLADYSTGYEIVSDTLVILLSNLSSSTVQIPAELSELFTITYDGEVPHFISSATGAAGVESAEPVDLLASSCGDELGNCDGLPGTNLADILHIISSVYSSGPNPIPHSVRSADVNCDCIVNLADILDLIGFVYGSEGPTPCSCSEWLTHCSQW